MFILEEMYQFSSIKLRNSSSKRHIQIFKSLRNSSDLIVRNFILWNYLFDYQNGFTLVRNHKVLNDVAESAVKLKEKFNTYWKL